MKAFFDSLMVLAVMAVVWVMFVVVSFVAATAVLLVLGAVVGIVYAVLEHLGVVKARTPVPPLDENGEPWMADVVDIYKSECFLSSLNFSQRMLVKAARANKPKHNNQLAELVAWDVRRRIANIESVKSGLGVKDRSADATQSIGSDGAIYDGVVNYFTRRLVRRGTVPKVLKDKLLDLYPTPTLA